MNYNKEVVEEIITRYNDICGELLHLNHGRYNEILEGIFCDENKKVINNNIITIISSDESYNKYRILSEDECKNKIIYVFENSVTINEFLMLFNELLDSRSYDCLYNEFKHLIGCNNLLISFYTFKPMYDLALNLLKYDMGLAEINDLDHIHRSWKQSHQSDIINTIKSFCVINSNYSNKVLSDSYEFAINMAKTCQRSYLEKAFDDDNLSIGDIIWRYRQIYFYVLSILYTKKRDTNPFYIKAFSEIIINKIEKKPNVYPSTILKKEFNDLFGLFKL